MAHRGWCLAAYALLFLSFGEVQCSHFRGAVLQYRPANPANFNGMIEVRHRIAWRRSYNSGLYCDQSTIMNQYLLGSSSEYLRCRVGCSGSFSDMRYYCIDYSASEDWSAGERSYHVNLAGVTYFEASFTGNAWVALVIGSGRWEVRLKGNLTQRPDNGRINTSPITTVTPILRLQHGCNHNFTIPVEDADGDIIRCRWASSSLGECGGVCNAFPATLDKVECSLRYEATGRTGLYVVALQVEDFANPSDTNPMSSVPVQFIVSVFVSSEACTSIPEFVPPTRVDRSCIAVPFNTTYAERITAQSGGPDIRITDITTASPSGLVHSELYESMVPQQWKINVTWNPLMEQAGPNIFCYHAVDSARLSSLTTCVTLVVGVEAPNIISNSMTPTGQIFPNFTSYWTIEFDKEFFRTPRSRYISVYESSGMIVERINAASSNDVTYPTGTIDRTLKFRPQFTLIEKASYYILLDPGVAVGPEFCNPESSSLLDPTIWTVSVADVTPPTLTFLERPLYSNCNVTISWILDEEATTTCTLQTPSELLVVTCNYTLYLSDLREGGHTLYIQTIDVAGNMAQIVRHSWTVDLTPPVIRLSSTPSAITYQTNSRFYFSCLIEWRCTYVCAIFRGTNIPNYQSCTSPYLSSGLMGGNTYFFSVVATDGVGNVGLPRNYTWRIDLIPPVISNVISVTVNCGDDFSPAAVGQPSASDNEDVNVALVYMDFPLGGCGLTRMWTATDSAGNIARSNQSITFLNPQAPTVSTPNMITVACGNVEEVSSSLASDNITVHHPCDRPVTLSFSDSASITQCGFTFTRIWTIADDCGRSTLFTQTIRVLDQQFPDGPENGLVNAGLYETLSWPQFSGATSYRVFVWRASEQQPLEPISVIASQSFAPTSSYPPGTRILWQIEYVIGANMTIPSPIWGFKTEPRPDLQVTVVTVPSYAFSGQSFSVSWTVINSGNLSVTVPRFVDRIFLGRTQILSDSRSVRSITQTRYVDVGDGYISDAEISLDDDDIGIFYVFVYTDYTRRVYQDIDRSNNIRVSRSPLQVRLTPPPNLNVRNIAAPSSVFSDTNVNVRWTVMNNGLGVTAVDQWYDRLYLSRDNQTDRNDYILHTVRHNGVLGVGSSYTQSESVTIPHAIYGEFFFIVVTDLYNNVYENIFENDNSNMSQVAIILSPPPDLEVTFLEVNDSIATGDQLVVTYIVTNEGAGPTFESQWTDRVIVRPLSSQRGPTYFYRRYNVMEAGSTYMVQTKFFIFPTYEPGRYNVSVHTDYRNQVFELTSDGNNMRWAITTIQERLPDLDVSSFSYSIEPTDMGNRLNYSYVVRNIGTGDTIGAPWRDELSIVYFSPPGQSRLLQRQIQGTELQAGHEYRVQHVLFIPSDIYGALYLNLELDARNEIVEENENNNAQRSTSLNVVPLFPDLRALSFRITSDTRLIIGGEYIELEWTVINQGEHVIPFTTWYDSISLSSSPDIDSAIKLTDVFVRTALNLTTTYQQRWNVTLPVVLDYSVSYYIILQVNSRGQINENGRVENNVLMVPIQITPPPSPDLQVESMSFNFFSSSRILTIRWTVRNVGNTMTTVRNWRDQILLSSFASFTVSRHNIVLGYMEQSLRLQADQSYTHQDSYIVPSTVAGDFFVYVMSDISNSVMEIDGEDNNVRRSDNVISISLQPRATFDISTNLDSLPQALSSGQNVLIRYTVTNNGQAAVRASSWVDGIYLSSTSNPSRSFLINDGLLIGQNINTVQLIEGQSYSIEYNVTIPYEVIGQQFLTILVDMNDVLNIQAVGTLETMIFIQQGPLPDITVKNVSSNMTLTSGQPAVIEYLVMNIGESSATGLWYEAVFFSQDSILDPFDTRLKTLINPSPRILRSNESYTQVTEVFIPYDLPTSYYYIIVEVNTRNDLFEVEVENNDAYVVVSITEAVSTDLAVVDVQVSPNTVIYGDQLTYSWRLRNNGSIQARGYKCDSVYLSEDDRWDISDYELDEPRCSSVTVDPYNNDNTNDIQYSQLNVAPFIAQQNYFGIVRTRSNIRDPNIENNIGSTINQIELNAPSLILGQPTNIGLVPNDVKVFRIEGLADEETLIASLSTEQEYVYHDLYLRHGQTPTGAVHDAFSQFSLSSFQRTVVRHTRSGDYYLRIESFTNSRVQGMYNVEVLVKVAQFEILDIAPVSAAPLGNVTIKISGTVLSYYSSAYLVSIRSTMVYEAQKVYWFNSESVYATFDISGMETGNFSVRLMDANEGTYVQLNNSFSIVNGISGQLSLVFQRPRALRAGEIGDFVIGIQNVGNTDLLSPYLVLASSDNVLFSLVDDSDPIDFSSQIDFIGLSLEGPGGILPPGAVTQVNFRISQQVANPQRAGVHVRIQDNGSAPHAYVNSKSALKPADIPSDVWDTIWNNFLKSVGTTQQSLQERLSEIASQLSLVGKRTYSVNRMVHYQLEVAYGLLSGNQILSVEDLFDTTEDNFIPLNIIRSYSAFIHKRRTLGPIGMGWLLNMWELHIENITRTTISLWKEREIFAFERDEESDIFTSGTERMAITSEGIYYSDDSGIFIYLFDSESGRLISIGGYVHNVTLRFYYSDSQLQSIENSGSFKRLNVTYTSGELIQRIQLITADNNVEKSSFYNYDSSERYLVSVITGDTAVQYDYNDNGDLIRATMADNTASEISYDENSFIRSIKHYDVTGELASHYDYSITWNGCMDITVRPYNVSTTLIHDREGTVVSVATDGSLPEITQELPFGSRVLLGDEVVTENKVEGSTTYSIDQKGIQNKFVNDEEGRLILFEDGDGYEYSFSYDNNGLQTGFGYPDGTLTALNYDNEGHLITLVNPDQSSISFLYDDEDNLVHRSHAGGNTFFEYDSRRVLLSAHNENGRITIGYDEMNRPNEVRYLSSGYTLYYGYNKNNLRTFIADNNGYNISYLYDTQFRLSEVQKSADNSLIAQFEYDGNLLTKKLLGNNAYSLYYYDSSDRLVELRNYFSNESLSSSNHYEYDFKGRVVKMTNSLNEIWTYRYDALGQVTGWISSNGEDIRYTYDNRGNRLVTERNGNAEAYTVNPMNQYMAYNDTDTFSYDQNGNLVEKVTQGNRESYQFDPEGRLISTETINRRCTYHYDAFGNLNTKNCTDGSRRYLVDPFGAFGSDIIAEISDEGTTYFVHSFTEGLLAALRTNGQSDLYYEFNLDGAVEKILDQTGRVLNAYKYDIFGRMTYKSEQIRSIFKYSGLLGAIHDEELMDVYMMRARHYDAQHGRFISLDPIGINGKSTNYYAYVLNNPITLKDPTGRIIPVIGIIGLYIGRRAVIGAAIGTATHLIVTPREDRTVGSIVGAAAGGFVSGLNPIKGVSPKVLAGIGAGVGEIVKYGTDYIRDGTFDRSKFAGDLINSVGFSLAWAHFPGKYLYGPYTDKLQEAFKTPGAIFGSFYESFYGSVYKYIYDKTLREYLSRKYGETLDNLQDLQEKLENEAMKLSEELKNLIDEIIEWIRAQDPNDILGPAGFGDAHFISPETRLDYKIRFENDPNATAPAQRVSIRSIVDDDLDIRSFRVGTFGFGDFVRNVTTSRSILQETINLTSTLGVFVRVRAGLDILRREASWEFQTLDPLTGEEPADPSIGFLPPNNITSGQGFVTFSVFVDDTASNLARIDAEASIIFDANEPIDTPPIFNTIDKVYPKVNLTINDELLDARVLAVNIEKMDVGSGVKNVDLFRVVEGPSSTNEVIPVVRGSTDNVVILPLNEGTQFTLFTSSVDYVGNREPLAESMQAYTTLDFPISIIMCPNNCSNNGNCTIFGDCLCEAGFYGSDCSQDTPPPEPPIFEIPLSVNGTKGQPIPIQIGAIIPDQSSLDGLEVYVDNLPQGSTFNRGRQEVDRWVFTPADFGVTELSLSSDYSGEFSIEVTAVAAGASRQRSLVITVQDNENTTSLSTASSTTLTVTVTRETSTFASTTNVTVAKETSTFASTTNVTVAKETSTFASTTTPTNDSEGSGIILPVILIIFIILSVVAALFLLTACLVVLILCVRCCTRTKKLKVAEFEMEITKTRF